MWSHRAGLVHSTSSLRNRGETKSKHLSGKRWRQWKREIWAHLVNTKSSPVLWLPTASWVHSSPVRPIVRGGCECRRMKRNKNKCCSVCMWVFAWKLLSCSVSLFSVPSRRWTNELYKYGTHDRYINRLLSSNTWTPKKNCSIKVNNSSRALVAVSLIFTGTTFMLILKSSFKNLP